MKILYLFLIASLGLSGCVVSAPTTPVVYEEPVVGANPVILYPAEPLLGETIIIEGKPYYRQHMHGRPYYHHLRHH